MNQIVQIQFRLVTFWSRIVETACCSLGKTFSGKHDSGSHPDRDSYRFCSWIRCREHSLASAAPKVRSSTANVSCSRNRPGSLFLSLLHVDRDLWWPP